MRVTRTVFENTLTGIAKLIEDAQNNRPQVAVLELPFVSGQSRFIRRVAVLEFPELCP